MRGRRVPRIRRTTSMGAPTDAGIIGRTNKARPGSQQRALTGTVRVCSGRTAHHADGKRAPRRHNRPAHHGSQLPPPQPAHAPRNPPPTRPLDPPTAPRHVALLQLFSPPPNVHLLLFPPRQRLVRNLVQSTTSKRQTAQTINRGANPFERRPKPPPQYWPPPPP